MGYLQGFFLLNYHKGSNSDVSQSNTATIYLHNNLAIGSGTCARRLNRFSSKLGSLVRSQPPLYGVCEGLFSR